MAPKVFLSHASEDKERFVLSFAKKLRENGIDVWLDKWEMLPGDSLVDKIFEEGIKNSSAIIVILSIYSIDKKWVREELNAAFVKRVSEGTKLIPVILDECGVPEALRGTVWEKIDNLDSYQHSFDRIISSIFGMTDKPILGSPPPYTQSAITDIGGLCRVDNIVLKLSCEYAIKNNELIMNPLNIFVDGENIIIPESELLDSLDILDQNGYIELFRTLNNKFPRYKVTTFGLETYAIKYIPSYQELITGIIAAVVNKKMTDNQSIRKEVNAPTLLVDHILDVFESKGYLNQAKMIGGKSRVYNISPELRRLLNIIDSVERREG